MMGDDTKAFELLRQQSLGACLAAWRIARAGLATAEGAQRLALQQIVAQALGDFLSDLGEHGLANAHEWGCAPQSLELSQLLSEFSAAVAAANEGLERGVASSLEGRTLSSYSEPFGSRDWVGRLRLQARHLEKPQTVARYAAKLDGRSD
jgi:hypothetical protein